MNQNTPRSSRKGKVRDKKPSSSVSAKKEPSSVFRARERWLTTEQIFQRAGYRFSEDSDVAVFFAVLDKELKTKRLIHDRLDHELRLRRKT